MKTLKELQISLFVLTLSLCFLTGCVSNQSMERVGTQAGSLPPVAEGMASFVLIDKSERAYTVFMAIPEEKQQEVRSQIAEEKDVSLATKRGPQRNGVCP